MNKPNASLFTGFTTSAPESKEKAPRFVRPWAAREALISTGMSEADASAAVVAQYVPSADALAALFVAAGLIFARPAYKETSKAGTVYTTGIAFKSNVRKLAPFTLRAALKHEIVSDDPEREIVSLLDCMLGGTAEGRERFAAVLAEVNADFDRATVELAALNNEYKAAHDKGRR